MSNQGTIRQDQTSIVGHVSWADSLGRPITPATTWSIDQPELTLTVAPDTQSCAFTNPSPGFTGVVNVKASAGGVDLSGTITITNGVVVSGQIDFDPASP